MAENSSIEWTTHTFNPWRGCTKISAGCANCYADTMSKRNPGVLGIWGPQGTRVVASEAQWKEPLKWEREARREYDLWYQGGGSGRVDMPKPERPRVFCASLADVFEDWQGPMASTIGHRLWLDKNGTWHSDDGTPSFAYTMQREITMQDVRNRMLQLPRQTPNLDWLCLTKRPENITRMMMPNQSVCDKCQRIAGSIPGQKYCGDGSDKDNEHRYTSRPIPNLWIGTSVENQQAADERIPHLLEVPAKVRFLSVEPLLGPVDLRCISNVGSSGCGVVENIIDRRPSQTDERINWVIIGGESGTNARPCRIEWVRDIVKQCREAGVPVFVKQLGANPVRKRGIVLNHGESLNDIVPYVPNGKKMLTDPKGGSMAEWPEDLRVRELPEVVQ
jgi:protein gp37